MKTTTTQLTAASEALFLKLANDAGNWNGIPLVDVTRAQRGNLTDLKKAGLVETETDEGNIWAHFTDAGYALASARGIEIRKPD